MSAKDSATHTSSERLLDRIRQLNDIGIALSAERDTSVLVEKILKAAIELTSADGGTFYTLVQSSGSTASSHRSKDIDPEAVESRLVFDIVINKSLGIHWGGTTGSSIPLPAIILFDDDGSANTETVAAASFHRGTAINIEDVRKTEDFDFSGTREFDRRNGYRTQSTITVPMRDHENRIIAVLQLINAIDGDQVEAFDFERQLIVESLASQASLALSNRLLNKDQRNLFESLIELIARAIDDKSPHTAHHCRRVPELTMMLAKAAQRQKSGPLSDFAMTEDEEYELQVASWLHDCGKIAIPEWIVDKATKLETPFDRVNLTDTRMEILMRDAEIERLQSRISRLMDDKSSPADAEDKFKQRQNDIREWRDTVRRCNIGVESMRQEDQDELVSMAQHQWYDMDGRTQNLLTEDELKNLLIPHGTLTPEERSMCNQHIDITIGMLESLTYLVELARVFEIAGAYYERMDGTGFPKGLHGSEMPVQSRAMAIADVFESLTADDRPYKKAMPLSQAMHILGRMKVNGHIDPDLFDLFVEEGIYKRYADEFLDPSRIDQIDFESLPGYSPGQN